LVSRILLYYCCIHIVIDASLETCEQDFERDQAEDWREHGCRACTSLPVDASSNCPSTGYDCDDTLPMRTNVLSSIDCECSQLRCNDADATLAVNRSPVGKLFCEFKQWKSVNGTVAESGICARKCGLRICRTLSASEFKNDPIYETFIVHKPDENHPCAWGSCPNGALGTDISGTDSQSYNGLAKFSCGGDRTWKGKSGQIHDFIKCKRKVLCEKIKPWPVAECNVFSDNGNCVDPKKSDTESFDCPDGKLAVMYDPDTVTLWKADEIKCDNSIGKWVYHLPYAEGGPLYAPQSEMDKLSKPMYQKWSCVTPR
ncbi:hypothetical protein PENTCL1PPCAC_12893, partial [Pristionchus entomophagus]